MSPHRAHRAALRAPPVPVFTSTSAESRSSAVCIQHRLGCPRQITFRRHNKKQLAASHLPKVNRTGKNATISTVQLS